jgi:cytochrome c oxidase subunit II
MAAATRSRTMDSRRSRRRGFGGTSPHIKGEMAQTVTPQHQPVQVDRTFWLVTIGLTLLNVILTVVIILLPMDYLLPGASLHVADRGDDIDFLYKFMSVFGNAIFVYVVGYIIYFAIAFRRRPDEPLTTIGVQIHDQPKLELWWTIIPSILIIILGAMSVRVWYAVQFGTGAPALTVEVIGHQFNYEFRYPGLSDSYYSTTEPMHLPVGRSVRVLVTSSDVIHSFWVPEIRLKADAVPGLVQNLNFTPQHAGTYDIVCTEFCGVNHSRMQAKLIIQPADDFNTWLDGMKKQQAGGGGAGGGVVALAAGDPNAGKALFAQKCSVCHQVAPFDQKLVGPGLLHLTDDPQHPTLVTGQSPTPDHIAAILHTGFTGPIGTMPNQAANGLSAGDIANLVAYLVSLK